MAFVFEDDQKATAPAAGADGGRFVFEDDEPAGLVIRQGKDPSLIDRVFDLFENPDKERAKAVQALVDAEVFNIRPSDAMRYRAAIDEGVKLNKNAIAASRRTNLMDRISQSWNTGVNQVAMGLHGADVVMNNDMASYQKMLEAQEQMPTEDTEYIPESKLEYAFRSAAKMSPMMFQVMKESVKKGIPAAMGVGGAVALLGQAGPQALLPEEAVTVPVGAAIGFKAGATGAAFTEALKLEAGLAFSEFMDMEDADGNKMDINIARAAAFGVGAINAGLEVAQVKMLLKTIPGSEKILKNAIMEAVASKVLKERLAGVAAMYAGTVAKETAVELAQESTNIVMEHVAANVNNALKGTDIKASDMAAVLDRLFETGKESAAAFSIMALPGSLARALPTGKRKSTPDAAGSPSLTGQDTIKAEASPADKTSQGPFILGVNEDVNGEVKSFTMADPTTGATYEVPALKAEDKDTVRYVPDMSALDTQADIDTQIDRIIEGQEDIDQISAKIFQDDIDETGFVEEAFTDADAKPETVLDRVKAINESLGEKGSIDLEPLIDLGRSIMAEGHQTIEAFTARAKELLSDVWEKVKYHIDAAWKILNNERGSVSMEPMTTPKGTASDIPAKTTPQAEAGKISFEEFIKKPLERTIGKDFSDTFLHGTLKKNIKYLSEYTRPDSTIKKDNFKGPLGKLLPNELNEFGAEMLLSEPRQPHQAYMWSQGPKSGMAEIKIKKGTKILDLSDEATRTPIITFGTKDTEVLKFFRRPAITDDFIKWYKSKVVEDYKTRFPDWEQRIEKRFDPESSDFQISSWQENLVKYAKEKGYGLVRLADETLVTDRSVIESVKNASQDTIDKAKNTRTYKPSSTASLFTGEPTGAYKESYDQLPNPSLPPAGTADIPAKTTPKPVGGKFKSFNIEDDASFDSLIDHIEGNKAKAIGLRGLYQDEVGKKKLQPSTLSIEYEDGTVGTDKLKGTSVTLVTGNWGSASRESLIKGFNDALSRQREYKYGDSGKIAIVEGNLLPGEIFNDIGEGVLGNAKVIGYLEDFKLRPKEHQKFISKLTPEEELRYKELGNQVRTVSYGDPGFDEINTEFKILKAKREGKQLPNPSRPPEVGGQTLYSGVDPTQIIPVLKSLTENLKEAWPHLEALGLKAYESGKSTYSAWASEMKSYLGDLWESFKGSMAQLWESVKAFNERLGERGSFSTKKVSTDDINMMLSAAARQDAATGGNITPESYLDLRAQAAQKAFSVIEKKMTRAQRREAAMLARQGEADARLMPVYSAMSHIVNAGGMSLKSLQADYDGNTIRELMNKRPGLVSNKGTMGPDVFADQHGFESGDDMINAILDWRGLKAEGKAQAKEFLKYYEKVIATDDVAAMREEFERAEQKALDELTKKYKPKAAKGIKKEIRRRTGQVQPGDRMVTEYDALTEAFRKEANTARRAFAEGKKEEVERSKEVMRWLVKRRESMKNVRDYFNLTDAEMMSATNRRNPALMDDAEFKQFLRNVELKAVELAETRQEKMALLKLIEDKRLKKVDNYRRALELPTFNDMTAQQLRDFAKLLEPFQEDDVFLTQRELETVDRTDLKGIRTWREARARMLDEYNKTRIERGLEPVNIAELEKVHVAALDSFRWDSSLRERDPFFNILVEQMTTASIGAELKTHEIESKTYELAKKSDKSRTRTMSERLIPRDDMIMAFIEAPVDQKAAIAQQMTPEQINYANFMTQYFAGVLDYLMARKSLERGRQNYFDHVRRTFLEKLRDGDFKSVLSDVAHAKFKSAFTTLFENNIQDQQNFNILDDDTGNILPLEKFIPNVLRRTDVMEPTTNVTRAFLKYVHAAEKMKMYDAIISKLDIYAQSLTPTRYTPRGLEIDRSLKTFVNKWINNKKGRRISFDSTLRQGGPLDVGIRALRAFTTILDLGLSPIAQTAALIGEQVTNAAMLGTKAMAVGTARMRTAQGKAILKKYESWVGRSLWEEFTAPGKEITERLSQALFAGFHLSSVSANKQFLLASLTDQEWATGEISTERLAEMRLDMGRFRVVPGTGSLVGSTSVGDAVMQYKKWAAPFARTLAVDAQKFLGDLKSKPIGEALTSREARELYRLAYLSMAVFVVGAMAGADDDDKSVMGKAKARMYREAMTLMQGVDPTLWLASPRLLTWLYQTASALKSVALMETYKSGDKEGELKGPDKMKRQFVPGVVRSVSKEENKR